MPLKEQNSADAELAEQYDVVTIDYSSGAFGPKPGLPTCVAILKTAEAVPNSATCVTIPFAPMLPHRKGIAHSPAIGRGDAIACSKHAIKSHRLAACEPVSVCKKRWRGTASKLRFCWRLSPMGAALPSSVAAASSPC